MSAVLILEDDSNLLELLVETFEDAGYAVQGASGPDEALQLAKRFKFDLVISDIRMAGSTDGLGVLQALKSARPELRTLVITGYASEDAPTRAIHIQVDDYIYKPFRLPAMLETVKRVLRTDSERQGYAKVLASILSVPKRFMEAAGNARLVSLKNALDLERDKTLQGYYVGIRSNLLSAGAALDLWDSLEYLEGLYARLLEEMPTQEQLQALGRGYRQAFDLMTGMTQVQSVGSFKNRTAEQLPRVKFSRLYDEIKAGRVTPEQLRIGFQLRRVGLKGTIKLTPELNEVAKLLCGAA